MTNKEQTWKALKSDRTCEYCKHRGIAAKTTLGFYVCDVKTAVHKKSETFRAAYTHISNVCEKWKLK